MPDSWGEKPDFNDYGSVMWEEYLDELERWLKKLKAKTEVDDLEYRVLLSKYKASEGRLGNLVIEYTASTAIVNQLTDKLEAVSDQLTGGCYQIEDPGSHDLVWVMSLETWDIIWKILGVKE